MKLEQKWNKSNEAQLKMLSLLGHNLKLSFNGGNCYSILSLCSLLGYNLKLSFSGEIVIQFSHYVFSSTRHMQMIFSNLKTFTFNFPN